MIREMLPSDLEKVLPLLVHIHLDSPYRHAVPDWTLVVNTLISMMERNAGLALVAEHKGEITGILLAVTETFWWVNQQLGAKIASDLVFYSRHLGDGRKMLQRMTEWAFKQPRVIRVQIAYSYDHPEHLMKRLYTSAGFDKMGSFWVLHHPRYQAMLDGVGQAA